MNLTEGATFLMDLIKIAKTRVNPKKNPRDTKQYIPEIIEINCWNTQIFQILCEICDRNFIFKKSFLSRLLKAVEITHKWISIKFKYQEPKFY